LTNARPRWRIGGLMQPTKPVPRWTSESHPQAQTVPSNPWHRTCYPPLPPPRGGGGSSLRDDPLYSAPVRCVKQKIQKIFLFQTIFFLTSSRLSSPKSRLPSKKSEKK
jgi:hypothetical protein